MPKTDPLRPVEIADLAELLRTAQAADTAVWGRPETDADDLVHELEVSGPLAHTSRVLASDQGIDGFVQVRGSECALTVGPYPTTTDRRAVAARLLSWARTVGGTE